MALCSLHHVERYVADLKACRPFWQDLFRELGWEAWQDWEGGFSFRNPAGGAYITLVQVEPAFLDIPYHRCRAGLNHLAFAAADRGEVDRLRDWALRKGARLLYEDRWPHAGGPECYSLFFEDPEGMKVEVIAEERP